MDNRIQNGETKPGIVRGGVARKDVPAKSESEKEKSSAAEQLRTLLKLNPMTSSTYYALNSEEIKEDMETIDKATREQKQTAFILSPVLLLINAVIKKFN